MKDATNNRAKGCTFFILLAKKSSYAFEIQTLFINFVLNILIYKSIKKKY